MEFYRKTGKRADRQTDRQTEVKAGRLRPMNQWHWECSERWMSLETSLVDDVDRQSSIEYSIMTTLLMLEIYRWRSHTDGYRQTGTEQDRDRGGALGSFMLMAAIAWSIDHQQYHPHPSKKTVWPSGIVLSSVAFGARLRRSVSDIASLSIKMTSSLVH